jgi:hypothetical protein
MPGLHSDYFCTNPRDLRENIPSQENIPKLNANYFCANLRDLRENIPKLKVSFTP